MIVNKLTYKLSFTKRWLLVICFLIINLSVSFANNIPDTIAQYYPDTLSIINPDTLLYHDTIVGDTIITTSITGDTVIEQKESKSRIEAKVERLARDSIVQNIAKRKVYLFGGAKYCICCRSRRFDRQDDWVT